MERAKSGMFRRHEGADTFHLYSGDPQSLGPSVLPKSTVSPSTQENPSETMANWPVDPLLHVPAGFTLQAPLQRPMLRHEVYITGCYTLYDEDFTIVRMQPPVHKEDFADMKAALRTFFHDIHQIGGADALEKIGLDYLEDDENEVDAVDDFDGNTDLGGMVDEVLGDNADEVAEDIVVDVPEGNADSKVDVVILDAPPPVFKTPRKKRAVRVKVKHDDSFLRRSKRISNKLQGFKDVERAKKAKKPAANRHEPVPLAMVPPLGCKIAPHLPKEILIGLVKASSRFSLRLSLLLCWKRMT